MVFAQRRRLRIAKRLWDYEGDLPPGSDARIRGGVHGRCILCGSRSQLRLSHVIPKWAYKWHKASWGGKIKGHYLSIGTATESQDGNKHYMMCDKCELFASESEGYIYMLIAGSWLQKLRCRIIELPKGWFLHLDAALLSRFVSITALRCHYAASAPFHQLVIPRPLRKQLRLKAFGMSTRRHPLIGGVRFVPPVCDPEHDPRCDLSAQFEVSKRLGPLFATLIGGWEWYVWFEPKETGLTGAATICRSWFVRIESASYYEYRGLKRMAEIVEPYREKLNRRS